MVSRLNWIDLLAGLLLVRLGYMGIRLGVGTELVKCAGLLVGLLVGFHEYRLLGDWMAAKTPVPLEWAGAMMLGGLVVVPYLLVGLFCRLIQGLVTIRFAPAVDKVGGGVVAVARAGVVMSVLLVILQQLPSEYLQRSIEERSWSGPYLVRVAPAMYEAVAPWVSRWVPGRVPLAGRSHRRSGGGAREGDRPSRGQGDRREGTLGSVPGARRGPSDGGGALR